MRKQHQNVFYCTVFNNHCIFREYCKAENITVLSDEIYGRLNFGHNHVCMAKVCAYYFFRHSGFSFLIANIQVYPEKTILTSGFSKWASAGGWRLGYAIFPPGPTFEDLKFSIISAASHTFSCAAAPVQVAIAEVQFIMIESLVHKIYTEK